MLSIIVPTYRREEDLEECLFSIRLNSDFNNEIIVLSPETTVSLKEVCERFSSRLVQDYSRNQESRRKGLWQIINSGIDSATFDFVCWMNDDCVVNKRWDSFALSYFKEDVGLVVMRTKGINKNSDYEVILTRYLYPCANYAVMRKSTGIRFDENFSWFFGDADLSLQFALKTNLVVVGTKENLLVHKHRIDAAREENENDPRIKRDSRYFDKKWRYKKRVGTKLFSMKTREIMKQACTERRNTILYLIKKYLKLNKA